MDLERWPRVHTFPQQISLICRKVEIELAILCMPCRVCDSIRYPGYCWIKNKKIDELGIKISPEESSLNVAIGAVGQKSRGVDDGTIFVRRETGVLNGL